MSTARQLAQAAVTGLAILAVSACSSGDDPAPETISLDRTSLGYAFARGESLDPPPETVWATYSGASVAVDMVPGAFTIPTLDVVPMGFEGQNPMPYEIHLFGISFTGPSGSYVTGLRFSTARADGSGGAFVDLPLVFDVHDELVVRLASAAQFSLPADAQDSRQATIYAHGIDWTAQADQDWIVLGATSGSGDSVTTLGVDTAGLPPGSYAGNAVFTRTASGYTVTIPVSVDVQP